MSLYPHIRLRRLRASAGLRDLVREQRVTLGDLMMPLFVIPGRGRRQPIASTPGQAGAR